MKSTNSTNKLQFDDWKAMAGLPQMFYDICVLYPIKLRDIAEIGFSSYLSAIQLLCVTKSKLMNILKDTVPDPKMLETLSTFELFMIVCSLDNEFLQHIEFSLAVFTKEDEIKVVPDLPGIVFGGLAHPRILTEEKFEAFQDLLRAQNRMDILGILDENPANDKAREILEKLRRGREKVAEIKRKRNEESNEGPEFLDLVGSLAARGNGLNILNIWDITYYAFHDQMKRMNFIEEYDVNTRAAMAGAKINKDKLKHWIRRIQSDN